MAPAYTAHLISLKGAALIPHECRPQEFGKYDADPEKHARSHSFFDPRQGCRQTCSVQHERFLGPELFFRPDFISSDYTTPLPQVQASFLSAAWYVAALSRDAVLDSCTRCLVSSWAILHFSHKAAA